MACRFSETMCCSAFSTRLWIQVPARSRLAMHSSRSARHRSLRRARLVVVAALPSPPIFLIRVADVLIAVFPLLRLWSSRCQVVRAHRQDGLAWSCVLNDPGCCAARTCSSHCSGHDMKNKSGEADASRRHGRSDSRYRWACRNRPACLPFTSWKE